MDLIQVVKRKVSGMVKKECRVNRRKEYRIRMVVGENLGWDRVL
jgi:hypothetical protein